MKITKIRTIAVAYPYESLEAEIITDSDKTVYLNFDYRDEMEDNTIDESWLYWKPLDELYNEDWDDQKVYEELTTEEMETLILKMKIFFRNKMDSKWDHTNQWHEYTE